jgi:hypothetical protein
LLPAVEFEVSNVYAPTAPSETLVIERWTPEQAEANFLRRWYELQNRRIN